MIRQTVRETLDECLPEDDEGRLRPEFRERLLQSLKAPGLGRALEDVARDLGVDV